MDKGEIFGIVGPDGSGKTTLLRILSGILKPDSGSVTIDNIAISGFIDRIGYMPQRFALYPDLTLMENIHFYSEIYNVDKENSRKKIKDLLSSFSIYEFKDRKAGKLSGGMKQKLALACTLIHTPELLILDEPTNGVDPVSRREFWNILYDLRQQGVTVITSTSYLEEAERCSALAMLYKGKVLAVNSVSNLKNTEDLETYSITSSKARDIYFRLKDSEYSDLISIAGNKVRIYITAHEKDNPEILEKITQIIGKDLVINRDNPDLEDIFQVLVRQEEKNV